MNTDLLARLLLLARSCAYRAPPDLHDPLCARRDLQLTVDGCNVFFEGKLIHEAQSHEEAILFRDRHIDAYT